MKRNKILRLLGISVLGISCLGTALFFNQKPASACDPQNPFECWQQQGTQQQSQPPLIQPTQQVQPQAWPAQQQPTQQQSFRPPLQGTRKAYDEIRAQGGFSSARVLFARNGAFTIEGRSWSNSKTQGVKSAVFITGYDENGNLLFVSDVYDIPTACSTWDACASDRTEQFVGNTNPTIAAYVDQIEVHLKSRGAIGGFRESILRTVAETCKIHDGLPTTVKAAIAVETGFPGCGM